MFHKKIFETIITASIAFLKMKNKNSAFLNSNFFEIRLERNFFHIFYIGQKPVVGFLDSFF